MVKYGSSLSAQQPAGRQLALLIARNGPHAAPREELGAAFHRAPAASTAEVNVRFPELSGPSTTQRHRHRDRDGAAPGAPLCGREASAPGDAPKPAPCTEIPARGQISPCHMLAPRYRRPRLAASCPFSRPRGDLGSTKGRVCHGDPAVRCHRYQRSRSGPYPDLGTG